MYIFFISSTNPDVIIMSSYPPSSTHLSAPGVGPMPGFNSEGVRIWFPVMFWLVCRLSAQFLNHRCSLHQLCYRFLNMRWKWCLKVTFKGGSTWTMVFHKGGFSSGYKSLKRALTLSPESPHCSVMTCVFTLSHVVIDGCVSASQVYNIHTVQ